MENDLAKFKIEEATEEIRKRPLGSDFLIFYKDIETLQLLTMNVARDLKRKSAGDVKLRYYFFDCISKSLSDQHGKFIKIKATDDEFVLKKVAEAIDNTQPCVLVILHFGSMHADMRINKWNQGFLRVMKRNEAGKSSIHKDSIIIAGFSVEGSIASNLYLPAFELI